MNRLRYFLYFRGIVLTTDRMLTLDKIYQASYALKTVIRRTDLISSQYQSGIPYFSKTRELTSNRIV